MSVEPAEEIVLNSQSLPTQTDPAPDVTSSLAMTLIPCLAYAGGPFDFLRGCQFRIAQSAGRVAHYIPS